MIDGMTLGDRHGSRLGRGGTCTVLECSIVRSCLIGQMPYLLYSTGEWVGGFDRLIKAGA